MRVAAISALCVSLVALAMCFAQVPATQSVRAGAATRPAPPEFSELPAATRVTLRVEKAQITKVMADLSQATGFTIKPEWQGAFQQNRTSLVTASLDGQNFWSALREIGVKANVSLSYNYDSERAITLRPNYGGDDALHAPATISGPFMVALVNLYRTNIIDMAEPSTVQRRVHLQFHTFAEPKIGLLSGQYQPTIDEATDDHGNPMAPTSSSPMNMQSAQGIFWWGNTELQYPANNPGQRIAKVRGWFRANAQSAGQIVEINDPLHAPTTQKSAGGGKVVFQKLTKVDDANYSAQFMISGPEEGGEGRMIRGGGRPPVRLLGAGNRSWQINGWQTAPMGNVVQYTVSFTNQYGPDRATGAPMRLVWEIPTGVTNFKVPFEFTDLPMP
jgi:hypothetical protein